MKNVLHILSLCLLCLYPLGMWAQFDVHFTHYWALQGYTNPAVAGSTEQMNIMATYSMQMAGFTNAPATMLIAVDSPFPTQRKEHAFGVGMLSDKVGLYNNQRIYGSYAYRMDLWGGKLAVGASAGVLQGKFDGTKVEAEERNDPAIPSASVEGNSLDVGAGLYYTIRNCYLGLAAMHLTAPDMKLGETNEIHIDRCYNLNAGCNIRLKNPLLSLQPSMQLMTDLQTWRADVTMRGTYTYDEKKYYVGATYSPLVSVAVLLGAEINGVRFGYAYELFTQGVGLLYGSHDIFLGYVTDMDMFKKGKNKHKSVRVL